MATLHVLRVFTAADGHGGNQLGVFVEQGLPESSYAAIAADLGYSETAFVEDAATARLRIFTPASELPLAGHPLIGTSWLLHELGAAPDVLRPPAGEVPTWRDGDITWLRANPEDAPQFRFQELGSADEVERLTGAPDGGGLTVAWAWSDRGAGTVRARAFLSDLGIAEDEATGAAALRLCALAGRPLAIHQGAGSLLLVRPADGGRVELGGRVEPDDRRAYDPPS